MSSHEEDQDRTNGKGVKRRRIGRACDMCRIKKIRCDGEQVPGQRCSNCAAYDEECTFVRTAPKRQSRPRGYVHRLEARVAAMESLLARVCPAADLSRELDAVIERTNSEAYGFDGSDTTDEGEDHDWIGRPNSKDEGSSMDRRGSDAFTYALPPAFSPTVSAQYQHTTSPPVSGVSSPTVEAASPTFKHHPPSSMIAPVKQSEDGRHEDSGLESSDDELSARHALGQLTLDPHNVSARRYFGKSSNLAIIQRALEMKVAYASGPGSAWHESPQDESKLSPAERALRQKIRVFDAKMRDSSGGVGLGFDPYRQRMRPLPCTCPRSCLVHPWARCQPETGAVLVFPEPELMRSLVDLYFSIYNIYAPVMHRPLFQAAMEDGMHLRNFDFGCVVLLICALGAKYSDDPRVLLDEDEYHQRNGNEPSAGTSSNDDEEDQEEWTKPRGRKEDGWHSAGWKWFRQIRIGRWALVSPPSLYDVQICCLASIYLRGSSAPEASRTLTGVGLRIAQDLGAHRRKVYGNVQSEERELLKRAFWVLVWLDWSISPALGRPCGIQYEDFDLDFPVECDDEYWVTPDPTLAFKQPEGKPSLLSYFNCQLRLNQINAFAMRTIYSTNKSKALLGFVGPEWEQRIVAELDSALNGWLDSIPTHLRWDPNQPNRIFLNQSASLYAAYYTLQVSIHRPFIPSPRKPSRTSFPSLAICTNAARSCVHVLDAVHQRYGTIGPIYLDLFPLFTAGIVLMLNMWGSGTRTSYSIQEMSDIQKTMDMLRSGESRWHAAGRLWDMLHELAIVGDLPLREDSSSRWYSLYKKPSKQPPVESKSRAGHGSDASDSFQNSKRTARHSISQFTKPYSTTASTSVANGSLPVRTAELGRLPLHPVFDSAPTSSYTEYDLSPSVFNPPEATRSASPLQDSVPVDPALESVFTITKQSRERRAASAPHIYAPQPVIPVSAPHPSTLLTHASTETQTHLSPPLSTPLSSTLQNTHSGGGVPDTLAMWSNAPQSFEYDDWGNYISNFNGPAEASSTSFVLGQTASSTPFFHRPGDRSYTYYGQQM